jgi:hypothetical protein
MRANAVFGSADPHISDMPAMLRRPTVERGDTPKSLPRQGKMWFPMGPCVAFTRLTPLLKSAIYTRQKKGPEIR